MIKKRKIFFLFLNILTIFLFTLLLISLVGVVSAINVEIQQNNSEVVMVPDLLLRPATFDLTIKNLESTKNFEVYNLQGFRMAPFGNFEIPGGSEKKVQVLIYPREDLDFFGFYTFPYLVRQSGTNSEVSRDVTIKMIKLEDAFIVGASDLNPADRTVTVFIKNIQNFEFTKMKVRFVSDFFDITKDVDLNAYERKTIDITLDQEQFKKLTAGEYPIRAEISIDNVNSVTEGKINFIEKDITKTINRQFGWVVVTTIIGKKNEGNVVSYVKTDITKNIISRLFTTVNPQPDVVERNGFLMHYKWEKEIMPGEEFNITVKTNWLFPFIIILFIMAVLIAVKYYSRKPLEIKKEVSLLRVKGKGDEIALKVTLTLKANSYVERINIIDRLPPLVKIFERFSLTHPTKIDEKNRRLEWDISGMEKGEKRILSYVIYTKIGILGKFSLPVATAVYEKNGGTHESYSNRAFLVVEQEMGREENSDYKEFD